MGEVKEEEIAPADVAVCMSSCEELVHAGTSPHAALEVKRKPRLYNYVYGPYRQHQFLVDCVLHLKRGNNCRGEEDVPGRMLPVGSSCLGRWLGNFLTLAMWYLALLLPFIFIMLGEVCGGTVMLCCCCIILCVLVSCHSITIFFILHNQKIAKRFWFINKVDLAHHQGRENKMMEVSVDNAMALEFLSAGQKSQVIARLARSNDRRGVMMLCTSSFWVSHVQDPLICLLILLILSLIGLVISIDQLRRIHF
ncbi:uncharacterized protein LOC143280543 [Babylonia areolata]|uniref:uncharacterized protein LOC143280543 n=1 Tax=Babylonia areolata TaxID=304850 RepID=UPI003FD56AD5